MFIKINVRQILRTFVLLIAAAGISAAVSVWLTPTSVRNVVHDIPLMQSAHNSTLYVFRLSGTSMAPTFRDGEIVLVVGWTYNMLKVKDVIVFKTAADTIAHRIQFIGVDDNGWFARTMGDNNGWVDAYVVRPNDVIGVVVH